MFEAYSQTKKMIVNVKDEFNLKEIFLCPNDDCKAELKIKGVTGARAKHFAKTRNSKHNDDCPYNSFNSRYINSENVVKSTIYDIYNNLNNPAQKDKNNIKSKKNYSCDKEYTTVHIKTPRQLYYFCINNSLLTEYSSNLKVGDIVLDSRNLLDKSNAKGINGIRLVVAKTYKYSYKDKSISLRLEKKTNTDKILTLHITLYMDCKLFEEIVNHILSTYDNKFKGHTIAILGNWCTTKPFNIDCTIKNKNHIIFKIKD